MNTRIQQLKNVIQSTEIDVKEFQKKPLDYMQRRNRAVSTSEIQDKVSEIESLKLKLANEVLKTKT